jgi:hypothetical protein
MAESSSSEQGFAVKWPFILRVVLKASGLFLLLNLLFAAFMPLEGLGRVSLYNWLLPGRQRLPYGENPADSYNLSLDNIPAMLASHVVSQPKAEDEFRVLVIGDSGTWGWLLENEDTLAGQINAAGARTADGRRILAYNLGYPIMALSKDLLLLDAALAYEPDLILWPVTLQSFPRDKQLVPPIVQNNPGRVRRLIDEHDLALDPDDPAFVEPDLPGRTIAGQRRALADLLRLQLYGYSWAATGVDQAIPDDFDLRATDLEADLSWLELEQPLPLDEEILALDILDAAAKLAAAGNSAVPILVVNEPIFISDGQNSDLRYNAWYPRWAYDDYREQLTAAAAGADWDYLDLWDAIPPEEFTDSPVHLTPAGTTQYADTVLPHLTQ